MNGQQYDAPKPGLRVHLEWTDYRPDSVIIAVITLNKTENLPLYKA